MTSAPACIAAPTIRETGAPAARIAVSSDRPREPPETEQSTDEGGGRQQGVHPARHAHHPEREGRRVVEGAAAHVVQIDDEVADEEQGDEPDEDDEDPP